jgi:AcrR family transcriptional regulator
MPRTDDANQRVRDEQRARILDGARAVFARGGMSATMADVAAAAGVSQGLAYRYFAGKDELFRALVAEAMRSDVSIGEGEGAPAERIATLLTAIIRARRDQPEWFRLLDQVISDPATPADLLEAVRRRGMAFVTGLRRLIVEGQAAGDVATGDPDKLVGAVIACLNGLTRFALDPPEERLRRFPDPEIILRMLRP